MWAYVPRGEQENKCIVTERKEEYEADFIANEVELQYEWFVSERRT